MTNKSTVGFQQRQKNLTDEENQAQGEISLAVVGQEKDVKNTFEVTVLFLVPTHLCSRFKLMFS